MKNISFGHSGIVDSGASDKFKGSLKSSLVSSTNKEISAYRSVVCSEGFKTNEDYLKGLAKGIADTYEGKIDKIKALSPADRELEGLVIYAPGAIIGNKANILQNLKILGTDESLTNVDYNKIPKLLRPLLAAKGIQISDRFKLMATNDMIGAGASVAKQLAKDARFKEGYKALFLMAGGGLGVGEIKHMGKDVLIEASENGHINVFKTGANLEQYGDSVSALIRNFSKVAGLSLEDTETLVNAGNAKVATDLIVTSKSKEEADTLKKTGLFSFSEGLAGESKFRLKHVSEAAQKAASENAINKFIEAISILGANKVTEGTNEIILTGPLTNGIQKAIAKEPELFDGKNLSELVMEKISSLLDGAGKNMAKIYKTKVVTDIEVPNNTIGGNLILKGKFIGEKIRGNWLSIPTAVLKKV